MRLSKFRTYHFIDDPENPGGGGGPIDTHQEPSEPVSPWPDNWREAYAGEDEKKLGILSRYQSVPSVIDAMLASQEKIRSGQYKETTPFPSEGTEEEQNAWRQNNNIPLKPEDYAITASDNEDDKLFAQAIQKFAHDNNIPKDYARSIYNFLTEQEQADIAAEKQLDDQLKQRTADELHAEMGADYRRNMNIIQGMLNQAPEGVKEALTEGRDAEGKPLAANANIQRWLTELALQVNPVSTLINPTVQNPAAAVEDELAQLNEWMRNNDPKYWKSEKAQKRWRDLTDFQKRQKIA